MKNWEVIADNLSKTGWSWACGSAIDSNGRTSWIADAHRDDGKRFVVHADEKLRFWNWNRRFAKIALTSSVGAGRLPLALSSLGVSARELHLTVFPPGLTVNEGSFTQPSN